VLLRLLPVGELPGLAVVQGGDKGVVLRELPQLLVDAAVERGLPAGLTGKGRGFRKGLGDEAIARRIERKEIVVIAEREAAIGPVDGKADFAVGERFVERLAENGQGEAAAPVDVEMIREGAVAA